MTDKQPRTPKVYVQEADGDWRVLPNPYNVSAEAHAADYRLANPAAVLRIATRKPRKPSTPASRAENRAKPARAARKSQETAPPVAKVDATNPGPANSTGLDTLNDFAAGDASPVFTSDEEKHAKWDERRIYRLERRHHMIAARNEDEQNELEDLLEALGALNGSLMEATGSQFASIMGEGSMNVDMGIRKITFGGKEVCAFNILAVGKRLYDVRLMSLEKPETIPDHRFLGGLRLLHTLPNLTAPQIIPELEKLLGVSLRKPMTQVEKLKGLLDKANRDFEVCPCDDCKEARARAKLNGSTVAEERARVDKGLEKLRQVLEQLSDTGGLKRIEDALKRSTMAPAHLQKATVN